ncbi:MAG: 30S ribosomal protein S1 [Chloroflexi bacterium]|nr:30S ribosomal protein S1 [Chloroflexota bacterium]
MVRQKRMLDNNIPPPDESWWASVLADEQSYLPRSNRRQPRPNERVEASLDWEKAQALYHQDAVVALCVTGYNRGGILVEGDGIQGFVPYSHLVDVTTYASSDDREKTLSNYVGRTLNLKVIECVPEDGRVVFSERAAQAGAGRRSELFSTLRPGQRVEGEVTNITDFGVFVDLGGVEGLIHISELSWGRVGHPIQVVQLRQRMEVQVLEVSPERCRVALSLKRLFDNPWEKAEMTYNVNQIVPAKVTSIVPYGAFARLDDGLEGLIHASEMPLEPGVSVNDLLNEGQPVQVRILHVDASAQRLGLSLNLNE